MISLSILFAAVIGFHHAFEADHVLAVGNIANKRNKFLHAIRDGMYWGLGHTSIIFLIGCIIILGKSFVNEAYFEFFEVIVGFTLVVLGIYRFVKSGNIHLHQPVEEKANSNHKLAYSVGLIHGLAGSGAVILIAMTELKHAYESILYLLIFGLGSIIGMMVVAGVFNLPFSKKIKVTNTFQTVLVKLTALLCIGYGVYMIVRYFL